MLERLRSRPSRSERQATKRELDLSDAPTERIYVVQADETDPAYWEKTVHGEENPHPLVSRDEQTPLNYDSATNGDETFDELRSIKSAAEDIYKAEHVESRDVSEDVKEQIGKRLLALAEVGKDQDFPSQFEAALAYVEAIDPGFRAAAHRAVSELYAERDEDTTPLEQTAHGMIDKAAEFATNPDILERGRDGNSEDITEPLTQPNIGHLTTLATVNAVHDEVLREEAEKDRQHEKVLVAIDKYVKENPEDEEIDGRQRRVSEIGKLAVKSETGAMSKEEMKRLMFADDEEDADEKSLVGVK
jgi:hypothetical protein